MIHTFNSGRRLSDSRRPELKKRPEAASTVEDELADT